MPKEKKILMYDDPNLVHKVTVEAWGIGSGLAYLHEDHARYAACTHKKCDQCSINIVAKGYTVCDACSAANLNKRFNSWPIISQAEAEEKFGSDCVMGSFDYDSCPVGDENDIGEWLHDFNEDEREEDEADLTLEDLKLVYFRPYYLPCIDIDLDEAPEDFELPKDHPINKALDSLNDLIKEAKIVFSYRWAPYRVDLNERFPNSQIAK